MAIGERIHFFRMMRSMTQKYLGMALGFPEKSADVRLVQYENGSRTPKANVTAALAQVLDISPKALDIPDIDSYTGLMHPLFTLEDRYSLEVCECEDEVHLRVHIHKGRDAAELHSMLAAWGAVAANLNFLNLSAERRRLLFLLAVLFREFCQPCLLLLHFELRYSQVFLRAASFASLHIVVPGVAHIQEEIILQNAIGFFENRLALGAQNRRTVLVQH